MENLITVLHKECDEYEQLLVLSKKKTPAIVSGDLEGLRLITDEEQRVVGGISRLDHQREEVMKDIANVLNKDVAALKLSVLIHMMGERPKEQSFLSQAHHRLQTSVKELQRINEQNRELLGSALELIAFDMNLIQAMRHGPETANYDRGAYNAGGTLRVESGGFDAKQ
jgi:flagellar biosynthesis/type III secretory pathway chaperone